MKGKSPIPLSNVAAGTQVQIINIDTGWGLQRRLADMGLTPNLRVRVIGSHKPGSVILDVRGSRLALGSGISNKIMVRIYEGE
jgi:ferrous iron transport protein A